MKPSITQRHGTTPLGATLGLVLVILCTLAPSVVRAQPGYQNNRNAYQTDRRDFRHDTHREGHMYRHDRPRYYDGYRDGYGYRDAYPYGAPPVVYAPQTPPGITLFLPFQVR